MLYALSSTNQPQGADGSALRAHKHMLSQPQIQSPISWSSPSFSLESYNLLFFPGGHDKGVRQVIGSEIIHAHVADYFPKTLRSAHSSTSTPNGTSPTIPTSDETSTPTSTSTSASSASKAIAAVCHGVMVLSESHYPDSTPSSPQSPPSPFPPELTLANKSVLHDVHTTALPAFFERIAFHGTRLFLGYYYKTYGAGSENVEQAVCKKLHASKKQWKGYNGFKPFVVEDERYRYVSARWPGDAALLAQRVVDLVRGEEEGKE